MDLLRSLRTTPASREFTERSVEEAEIAEILDDARFAPSGGNRQAWKVVVIRDPEIRKDLRDLYLLGWYRYLSMTLSGLTPFAPITDLDAERKAIEAAPGLAEHFAGDGSGFAEQLHKAPALLLVAADLRELAAVDRDLDRYSFAGGASVYPFAWSVLLAARARGLGGVITTMPIVHEDELKALVHLPEAFAVACLIVLGEPKREITKLRRQAVSDFTTIDYFDGESLGS